MMKKNFSKALSGILTMALLLSVAVLPGAFHVSAANEFPTVKSEITLTDADAAPAIGDRLNLVCLDNTVFANGTNYGPLDLSQTVKGDAWYLSVTVNFSKAAAWEGPELAFATGTVTQTGADGTPSVAEDQMIRVQIRNTDKAVGQYVLNRAPKPMYTYGNTVLSGEVGFGFEENKDYRVTIAVSERDKLSLWVDDAKLISGQSLAALGITDLQPCIGWRCYGSEGTMKHIQVWDDISEKPTFIESFSDISAYRTAGAYTAPTKDGYVFAGWFTDAEATSPVADETTNVYAKFVTQDVLSVKGQLKAGTTAESLNTDYRFSTTVDSLNYQNIGFSITVNGNTKSPSSTTVYKKITARSGNEIIAHDPTVFSAVSQYFHTYTITGIPQSAFATEIQIAAYWTTLDGTVVTGPARTLTVNMGIN